MKRFVFVLSSALVILSFVFWLFFSQGFYIFRRKDGNTSLTLIARTQGKQIQVYTENAWTEFEIRGVNMGSGMPGAWSTDYKIDKSTYLRWFEQIHQMGANVIRVYGIQNAAFYHALSTFNAHSATPLYLIQGIWVDDYVQNSHMDAYDSSYRQRLIEDCKATVDVLHGRCFLLKNDSNGSSGLFLSDVSDWVLGYVIGGEWTDVTVAYTNESHRDLIGYSGNYLCTDPDASAFEKMLAEVGDRLVTYEDEKYAEQKLLSFANGRSTDPFLYPDDIIEFYSKCASIDMEHIHTTENFQSGLFASYSVYSYDLDYLSLMQPEQWQSLTPHFVDFQDCDGTTGNLDTFLAYLKLLNAHHTIPVVVIEYGENSSRGTAQQNSTSRLRNGYMSETEQADRLVQCYQDIISSGCSGSCVFSWQDEWSKRIWNTMFSTDLSRNVYWNDAQTGDQHFGILAFDPGKTTICVIDGDVSEWSDTDIVKKYSDGSSISLKYDEGYIYLRVYKPGYVFGKETLYIPIDTTSKTGSTTSSLGLTFDKPADFLIQIHQPYDSALMVQNRYHAIYANYSQELTGNDAYVAPPAKDSPVFEIEKMAIKDSTQQFRNSFTSLDCFETGRLRYGNTNPSCTDYDSLADFMAEEENIEIRIPWALLNFSDPSRMQIHDDYYDGNYGVRSISLRHISIGIGTKDQLIEMGTVSLKGWRNRPTYHERLKPVYYALQSIWTGGETS